MRTPVLQEYKCDLTIEAPVAAFSGLIRLVGYSASYFSRLVPSGGDTAEGRNPCCDRPLCSYVFLVGVKPVQGLYRFLIPKTLLAKGKLLSTKVVLHREHDATTEYQSP